MPWSGLLSAERVVMLVAPGHRDAVLDAAARLLCAGSPHATLSVATALRDRERVGSTAIGRGVAIPHCRTGAHARPVGAFLRLGAPVDFGAADGEPVDLVFAMSVPSEGTQEHLDTLSALATHFADPACREALRAAPDVAALRALLLAPRA
jgi:PTS system nitrogen regulatory IIA component